MLSVLLSVVGVLLLTYRFLDWCFRSLTVGNYGDKHVFVTGCDSGFGRALARRLDGLGFHVFAGCLTEEGAQSLSADCSSHVTPVSLNVTQLKSIEAAVKVVQEKLPVGRGLWGVVNNAGIPGYFAPVEFMRRSDYISCFDVNLLGVIEVTRLFLPLLRREKGRVVNIASVAGRLGFVPGAYGISKYGVEGFSDLLRRQICPQGIKVSILEPGGFRTNITPPVDDPQLAQRFEQAPQEMKDAYGPDFLDRWAKGLESFFDTFAPDISPVVDAYTHALTARYPRTRYTPGRDAAFLYIPLSYLPTGVADWVLAKIQQKTDRDNGFS